MASVVYTINVECFDDCDSQKNNLRCISQQDTNELIIACDSIVSIVPQKKDGDSLYRLLYFRDGEDTSDLKSKHTLLESIQLATLPTQLRKHLFTQLPSYLRSSGPEGVRIDVIVSTTSGTGTGMSFYSNILQPLLFYIGVTNYELHETKSTRTITELCYERFIPRAKQRLPQTIILLSGDGGLTDMIDAFHSTPESLLVPPTIALIPTGTGNAMANSIGLLAHPTAGLVALLQGTPTSVPTFVAEFSPGASYIIDEGRERIPITRNSANVHGHPKVYGGVVASWGLHAALVADSDTVQYRKFGADRFKLAAKELLYPSDSTEPHKFSGIVTLFKLDDQGRSKREETLACTEHMPLDGRLWMVHFEPMSASRVMQVMASAYQAGQHVADESVSYGEIEGFRIEFREVDERWRRVCIDGKIIAVEHGGWVEVHKASRALLEILQHQKASPGCIDN
ncbi:hypothetical protein AnigIFM60653_006164 [Aspergillus niger]|nr:hypothetical protein AnigIFM60653_006164 [Aspergillus niger]